MVRAMQEVDHLHPFLRRNETRCQNVLESTPEPRHDGEVEQEAHREANRSNVDNVPMERNLSLGTKLNM